MTRRFPALLALALLVAACAQQSTPGEAVEAFHRALVAADEDALYDAVCPEWEAQAGLELDAFSGVSARLERLRCTRTGSEGDLSLIACSGTMVLDYRGEERERPLEGTTYLARKVDGEWKMCGYR